jgi:hypothetical protein
VWRDIRDAKFKCVMAEKQKGWGKKVEKSWETTQIKVRSLISRGLTSDPFAHRQKLHAAFVCNSRAYCVGVYTLVRSLHTLFLSCFCGSVCTIGHARAGCRVNTVLEAREMRIEDLSKDLASGLLCCLSGWRRCGRMRRFVVALSISPLALFACCNVAVRRSCN